MKRRRALALALAIPSLARAAAYDVESRTEAQVYTIGTANPDSGRSLQRRRLVEVLDLAGFELVPGEDAGLSLQLRLDADFSVNDREVAGLDDVKRAALQLTGARFHWAGLAGGRLDLDVGRITALDPIAFFRFDGGRATVRPVSWLGLSAFGGLRVTGSSWLGAPTFAPDGTRQTDRRRIGEGLPVYPCPGEPSRICADQTLDDPAPTFGARLAVLQLPGGFASGAELEYRRTLRAGKIIEERASGGARYRRGAWGADAGGEWDLYVRRLSALRAALRWSPGSWLALTAEGLHAHPTYSADSIWNAFVSVPSREGRLRADLSPAGWPARVFAAAGVKQYAAPDFSVPDLPSAAGWEPFAAAGASATLGETVVSGDVTVRDGSPGRQAWLTALLRRSVSGWLSVEGRATLARLDDKVASKNSGTFPALALLLAGKLDRRAQLSVLLEDSAPRWERNDLRLFAFLTLGAEWDTRMAR